MTIRLLGTINDIPVNFWVTDAGCEIIRFKSGMMIDNDGSGGNPEHDPFHQSDTTLHRDGVALNPYEESFVVVPPLVCQKTKGIVLGSFCFVQNTVTQACALAVVGDVGPHDKIGEASPACAKQVNVNSNPNTGGEERHILRYTIFVAVPAVILGKHYVLQKYSNG